MENLQKPLKAETREKEVREKAGLPDVPIMKGAMAGGFLWALRKKKENYPSDDKLTSEQIKEMLPKE